MTARSALLYDTAASLRLLDTELRALDAGPSDVPPHAGPPAPAAPPGGGLAALPFVLARAHAEVHGLLGVLRDSRAALDATTVEKLQPTSAKLREVTSATETAATDILDALDRTQAMVDEWEAAEADGDRGRTRAVRERMRDELFGMVGALQFQDITTQQLAHATGLLHDLEGRLQQIAALFDPAAALAAGAGRAPGLADALAEPPAPDPRTYDPRATTRDAEARQALADAVFVGRGGLR